MQVQQQQQQQQPFTPSKSSKSSNISQSNNSSQIWDKSLKGMGMKAKDAEEIQKKYVAKTKQRLQKLLGYLNKAKPTSYEEKGITRYRLICDLDNLEQRYVPRHDGKEGFDTQEEAETYRAQYIADTKARLEEFRPQNLQSTIDGNSSFDYANAQIISNEAKDKYYLVLPDYLTCNNDGEKKKYILNEGKSFISEAAAKDYKKKKCKQPDPVGISANKNLLVDATTDPFTKLLKVVTTEKVDSINESHVVQVERKDGMSYQDGILYIRSNGKGGYCLVLAKLASSIYFQNSTRSLLGDKSSGLPEEEKNNKDVMTILKDRGIGWIPVKSWEVEIIGDKITYPENSEIEKALTDSSVIDPALIATLFPGKFPDVIQYSPIKREPIPKQKEDSPQSLKTPPHSSSSSGDLSVSRNHLPKKYEKKKIFDEYPQSQNPADSLQAEENTRRNNIFEKKPIVEPTLPKTNLPDTPETNVIKPTLKSKLFEQAIQEQLRIQDEKQQKLKAQFAKLPSTKSDFQKLIQNNIGDEDNPEDPLDSPIKEKQKEIKPLSDVSNRQQFVTDQQASLEFFNSQPLTNDTSRVGGQQQQQQEPAISLSPRNTPVFLNLDLNGPYTPDGNKTVRSLLSQFNSEKTNRELTLSQEVKDQITNWWNTNKHDYLVLGNGSSQDLSDDFVRYLYILAKDKDDKVTDSSLKAVLDAEQSRVTFKKHIEVLQKLQNLSGKEKEDVNFYDQIPSYVFSVKKTELGSNSTKIPYTSFEKSLCSNIPRSLEKIDDSDALLEWTAQFLNKQNSNQQNQNVEWANLKNKIEKLSGADKPPYEPSIILATINYLLYDKLLDPTIEDKKKKKNIFDATSPVKPSVQIKDVSQFIQDSDPDKQQARVELRQIYRGMIATATAGMSQQKQPVTVGTLCDISWRKEQLFDPQKKGCKDYSQELYAIFRKGQQDPDYKALMDCPANDFIKILFNISDEYLKLKMALFYVIKMCDDANNAESALETLENSGIYVALQQNQKQGKPKQPPAIPDLGMFVEYYCKYTKPNSSSKLLQTKFDDLIGFTNLVLAPIELKSNSGPKNVVDIKNKASELKQGNSDFLKNAKEWIEDILYLERNIERNKSSRPNSKPPSRQVSQVNLQAWDAYLSKQLELFIQKEAKNISTDRLKNIAQALRLIGMLKGYNTTPSDRHSSGSNLSSLNNSVATTPINLTKQGIQVVSTTQKPQQGDEAIETITYYPQPLMLDSQSGLLSFTFGDNNPSKESIRQDWTTAVAHIYPGSTWDGVVEHFDKYVPSNVEEFYRWLEKTFKKESIPSIIYAIQWWKILEKHPTEKDQAKLLGKDKNGNVRLFANLGEYSDSKAALLMVAKSSTMRQDQIKPFERLIAGKDVHKEMGFGKSFLVELYVHLLQHHPDYQSKQVVLVTNQNVEVAKEHQARIHVFKTIQDFRSSDVYKNKMGQLDALLCDDCEPDEEVYNIIKEQNKALKISLISGTPNISSRLMKLIGLCDVTQKSDIQTLVTALTDDKDLAKQLKAVESALTALVNAYPKATKQLNKMATFLKKCIEVQKVMTFDNNNNNIATQIQTGLTSNNPVQFIVAQNPQDLNENQVGTIIQGIKNNKDNKIIWVCYYDKDNKKKVVKIAKGQAEQERELLAVDKPGPDDKVVLLYKEGTGLDFYQFSKATTYPNTNTITVDFFVKDPTKVSWYELLQIAKRVRDSENNQISLCIHGDGDNSFQDNVSKHTIGLNKTRYDKALYQLVIEGAFESWYTKNVTNISNTRGNYSDQAIKELYRTAFLESYGYATRIIDQNKFSDKFNEQAKRQKVSLWSIMMNTIMMKNVPGKKKIFERIVSDPDAENVLASLSSISIETFKIYLKDTLNIKADFSATTTGEPNMKTMQALIESYAVYLAGPKPGVNVKGSEDFFKPILKKMVKEATHLQSIPANIGSMNTYLNTGFSTDLKKNQEKIRTEQANAQPVSIANNIKYDINATTGLANVLYTFLKGSGVQEIKPFFQRKINFDNINFEQNILSNAGAECYINATLRMMEAMGTELLPLLIGKSNVKAPCNSMLAQFLRKEKINNINTFKDQLLEWVNQDEVINGKKQSLEEQFSRSAHADAQEFFARILTKLGYQSVTIKKNETLVRQQKELSSETNTILSLPITDIASVQAALNAYEFPSVIEDRENPNSTDRSDSVQNSSIQPIQNRSLLIQLKRFKSSGNNSDRDGKKVTVDPTITVDNKTYELASVIVQTGTLNSGHYRAFVREANKWVEYDDTKRKEIDECQDDMADNGYLLRYVLKKNN